MPSAAHRAPGDCLVAEIVHGSVELQLSEEVDLFHATFRAPPDWLPPALPRIATVHDVRPLRILEESTPDATGMLKALLSSLDPARDVVVAVSNFTKRDSCDLSGFHLTGLSSPTSQRGRAFARSEDANALAELRARFGLQDDPFLLPSRILGPAEHSSARPQFLPCRGSGASVEWKIGLVGHPKAGWGGEVIDPEVAEHPDFANRVIRARGVSDAVLALLYSGCEAFLFPSTYEGFGLPVS